ncbi:MAG: ABC transporter permease [Nitrospinota bacterium]
MSPATERNPAPGMSYLKKYYSLLLLLVAWQTVSHFELVPAFFLPSVTTLAFQSYEEIVSGRLPADIILTIYRSLLGFLLAIIVGVPLGVTMARVKPVRWLFDPIISIGFPAPKISFIPIFVLWFGFFSLPKIMLTSFACVFPVVNMTYLGTIGIDKYLVWSARNMGTDERKMLWKVVVPAALPQVFNGVQVAFPVSLIIVTVSEMLGGGGGIGASMMMAARFADMPVVFVNLLAVSFMGFVSMKLLARGRKLLLHWHEETQVTY